MALELGPKGIRTNAVLPTVTLTPLGRKAWADENKAKVIRKIFLCLEQLLLRFRFQAMKNRIPLGRFAEENEIVDAIMYLLSDSASMINGALLPVDGGFFVS